jgi:hypothetical protein
MLASFDKVFLKGIIPVTKEEALDWCEEHLDIEDYQEYFSDMIEDA